LVAGGLRNGYVLSMNDAYVEINGNKLLSNISLHLKPGEVYVLLGPNGSGKTSLLKAIMGLEGYDLLGDVKYLGLELSRLSITERAEKGIFLGYQDPLTLKGVEVERFLKRISNVPEEVMYEYIRELKLSDYLTREVNRNFSGGERKRLEVLQALIRRPRLLLLDEIDSGVDVESVKLIGRILTKYFSNTDTAGIIVTHQAAILNHFHADKACVILDNTAYCYPDPDFVITTIMEKGYSACRECTDRIPVEKI